MDPRPMTALRLVATRMLLLLLGSGLSVSAARATTLDLSWTDCSPITADLYPTAPGITPLTVSCIGQSLPHQGYAVAVLIADDQGVAPDAWRFDAAGCNPIGVVTSLAPSGALAKSCPRFSGSSAVLGLTGSYGPSGFASIPVPATTMLCHTIAVFPATSQTTDPNQRYFLMRVLFDHTSSVVGAGVPGETCGGLERTVFLKVYGPKTEWIDAAGIGTSLFTIGNGTAIYHGSSILPTPATARTWGQLKAQYR